MKSGVEIILSKLSELVLPYDTVFEIEKHVYHCIHSHKQSIIHNELLYSLYQKEFPQCTPIVCACQKGRLGDLKIFIAGRSFDNVKKLLVEVGNDSYCRSRNALMAAAEFERDYIIEYISDCGVNLNCSGSNGWNALHYSARYNEKSTRCTELLLKKMPLESVNKKANVTGYTPLDCAYFNYYSPIKNDIIQLIRQHGGEATYFDRNGKFMGNH